VSYKRANITEWIYWFLCILKFTHLRTSLFLRLLCICCSVHYSPYYIVSKKWPPFYFWITLPKINWFQWFLVLQILRKFFYQKLLDLPIPVSCSHCTLGNPKSHYSTILFIRDSDYLHYLRIKRTVTVTVQLNHNCLLTVSWRVLLRHVGDARAAASDPQHCWRRVCLSQRQCTSTLRLWHSRASALWDTAVHQSWHVASQQSWPKPGWLLHLSMMQKCVYQVPIRCTHELRQQIVETWAELQKSVVDDAIDQ